MWHAKSEEICRWNLAKIYLAGLTSSLRFKGQWLWLRLEELSLLTPEIWSSNPVIDKKKFWTSFTVNCFEKEKIKKKRPEWPIFKKGSKSFWHQSEYGLIPKINEKEAGAGPFLKKDLPQVYTKGRFTLKDILLHC